MKRIGLILTAFLLGALPLYSQIVTIPDTAFLYALIEEGVDTNGDSLISPDEAEITTYLDISSNWEEGKRGEIKNIKGIEAFINLDTLRCNYNQLSSLDISHNTALERIGLRHNPDLQEVCVWNMPFPPEVVKISTDGSPNIYFTSDCSSGR
jgi:hypothetical protein